MTFTKDPNAVLDYTIDWTRWLAGDQIATSQWLSIGWGNLQFSGRYADGSSRRSRVNGVQLALSGVISMVVYGLLFAGVYKLFAISSQLNEIKDLLKRRSPDADSYLAHAAQLQNAAREWTVLEPKE